MKYRRVIAIIAAVPLVLAPGLAGAIAYMTVDDGKPSICHGDAVNGRLQNGKRLPYAGPNFRAYHIAGYLTARTFMHSQVRDAVRDSYAALAASDPELRFVYAESGWPWGGRFRPHRTHANGTSVDFMVPLRTASGAVTEIRASVANKLGYSVAFDDEGRGDGVVIDFEAMSKHLIALDNAARAHGVRISRVIFEPPLQRHLFASASGRALAGRMSFMKTHAWVRHDQHYHVDFAVPCQAR